LVVGFSDSELQADLLLMDGGLDSLALGALSGAVRRATGQSFNIAQVMEENMSIQEVASSIAEKVLGASLEREGPSEAEGPLFLSRHISQTSVAQGTAAEWPSSIAIPIVFVLNSPRSGSTLFQLILNTHPRLWAPQELHIIMFSTVGEWRQWLWGTVYVEPLIGAVLELLQYDSAPTNGDARARVASWSHDAPIYDVYMHLQQGAKPTILVDKSPMNAEHPAFIRRAVRGWQDSSFIHLFRHPVPAIQSTVELRQNVGLVQGFKVDGTVEEQCRGAEATWLESNRNIADVLSIAATSDSMTNVNYERLVTAPEQVLRGVCTCLQLDWEPQMLHPYDADSTKSFRAAETVFVGDPKLFKRARIEAKQADKWRKVTLPVALRSATISLARELGYTDFPLQLPPELEWLKAPQRHSSQPPSQLLLCIHPGIGVFDGLVKIVLLLSWPSLGLRLTSRSVRGCQSIAHLEQRYWELADKHVALGRSDEKTRRHLLGHSLGCRIAFSFASRLSDVGCRDVRVVLLDGRVSDQVYFQAASNDGAAAALLDAVRAKYGDEAVDNVLSLPGSMSGGGYEMRHSMLARGLRVLYVESEEPMGLERVRELAFHVDVVHIEGWHVEALQRVSRGEGAHTLARKIDAFLA